MQIKLFGKNLFEFNSSNGSGLYMYNSAVDKLKESKFLIDFVKDTGNNPNDFISSSYAIEVNTASDRIVQALQKGKGKGKPEKEIQKPPEITPKDAFKMELLNDKSFVMKTDPAYIDEQLETFKEKLGMIKKQEMDWNHGTSEIGSIIQRFENRKKYPEFKEFYGEFPYTTTTKINEMTKNHTYLKLGEVSQFLADMPKEAVDVMKKYTDQTVKLCDKKPVFYIIANKKDFEKSQSRRDPILLAQSPFGHFWQILGAWDEEMLLIEEL